MDLLSFTPKVKMFCRKILLFFQFFPFPFHIFSSYFFLTIVYKKSEHTSKCFSDFKLNHSFSFTLCRWNHRSVVLWLIYTCILYWSKHPCSWLQWDSSSPAAQTWGCIWKRKYSPGALRELGISSTLPWLLCLLQDKIMVFRGGSFSLWL